MIYLKQLFSSIKTTLLFLKLNNCLFCVLGKNYEILLKLSLNFWLRSFFISKISLANLNYIPHINSWHAF